MALVLGRLAGWLAVDTTCCERRKNEIRIWRCCSLAGSVVRVVLVGVGGLLAVVV